MPPRPVNGSWSVGLTKSVLLARVVAIVLASVWVPCFLRVGVLHLPILFVLMRRPGIFITFFNWRTCSRFKIVTGILFNSTFATILMFVYIGRLLERDDLSRCNWHRFFGCVESTNSPVNRRLYSNQKHRSSIVSNIRSHLTPTHFGWRMDKTLYSQFNQLCWTMLRRILTSWKLSWPCQPYQESDWMKA